MKVFLRNSRSLGWLLLLCLCFPYPAVSESFDFTNDDKACRKRLVEMGNEYVAKQSGVKFLFYKVHWQFPHSIASSVYQECKDIPNCPVWRVQQLVEKEFENRWRLFLSTPGKAAVFLIYFGGVVGIPLTVGYLTSSLDTWVTTGATVVSGLITGYVFAPWSRPFMTPYSWRQERRAVKWFNLRGDEDAWLDTYERYTQADRDVFGQINNIVLSVAPSLEKARESILQGKIAHAVKLVGDAAMRFYESYGGISPKHITLIRFAQTYFADGMIVPPSFEQQVLSYINKYYRANRDRLPECISKIPEHERAEFFEAFVGSWLRPTDLDQYLPRVLRSEPPTELPPSESKSSESN